MAYVPGRSLHPDDLESLVGGMGGDSEEPSTPSYVPGRGLHPDDLESISRGFGGPAEEFQPEEDDGVTAADYGRSAMAGLHGMGSGLGWFMRSVGIEEWGKAFQEGQNEKVDTWMNSLSPAAQEAVAKEFIRTNEDGTWDRVGDFDRHTVGLLVAGSLPSNLAMFATGYGAVGVAAKGLSLLANPFARTALQRTIKAGTSSAGKLTTTAIQAKKKLDMIDRVLPAVAGGISFGAIEGALEGSTQGNEVYTRIMQGEPELLWNQQRFQQIYQSTDDDMDPLERFQYASHTFAMEVSKQAAKRTFATTAAAGAPLGMALGKRFLNPKSIARLGAQSGSRAGVAASRVGVAALVGIGESTQEAIQSGMARIWQNIALQELDTDIATFEGVINDTVGGAIVGFAVGVTVGTADPAVKHAKGTAAYEKHLQVAGDKELEHRAMEAANAGAPQVAVQEVVSAVTQGTIDLKEGLSKLEKLHREGPINNKVKEEFDRQTELQAEEAEGAEAAEATVGAEPAGAEGKVEEPKVEAAPTVAVPEADLSAEARHALKTYKEFPEMSSIGDIQSAIAKKNISLGRVAIDQVASADYLAKSLTKTELVSLADLVGVSVGVKDTKLIIASNLKKSAVKATKPVVAKIVEEALKGEPEDTTEGEPGDTSQGKELGDKMFDISYELEAFDVPRDRLVVLANKLGVKVEKNDTKDTIERNLAAVVEAYEKAAPKGKPVSKKVAKKPAAKAKVVQTREAAAEALERFDAFGRIKTSVLIAEIDEDVARSKKAKAKKAKAKEAKVKSPLTERESALSFLAEEAAKTKKAKAKKAKAKKAKSKEVKTEPSEAAAEALSLLSSFGSASQLANANTKAGLLVWANRAGIEVNSAASKNIISKQLHKEAKKRTKQKGKKSQVLSAREETKEAAPTEEAATAEEVPREPALTPLAFKAAIEGHSKGAKGIINIVGVDTVDQIPADGAYDDTSGVWIEGTHKVYIVREKIRSHEHLKQVVAHEVFGHFAMEQIPEFQMVLNTIQNLRRKNNPLVAKISDLVDRTHNYPNDSRGPRLSEQEQAKEILAAMVEYKIRSPLINRARAAARAFLRRIGIKLEMTESDELAFIDRMIVKGAKALKSRSHSYRSRLEPGFDSRTLRDPEKTEAEILSALDRAYADSDHYVDSQSELEERIASIENDPRWRDQDMPSEIKERLDNLYSTLDLRRTPNSLYSRNPFGLIQRIKDFDFSFGLLPPDRKLTAANKAQQLEEAKKILLSQGLDQYGRPFEEPTPELPTPVIKIGKEDTVVPVGIATDTLRVGDILGPQLYGSIQDFTKVTTKELYQNSFDAIKDSMALGEATEGRIDIVINNPFRTITMKDDGHGMSPDTITKAFLTIAGTEKYSDRRSGSFGIAKALFLLHSKKMLLITVRDGIKSTLETSGKQLRDWTEYNQKRVEGDAIPESPKLLSSKTDEPNGTLITIAIPDSYTSDEGEDVPLSGPEMSDVKDILRFSPLFENIDVNVAQRDSWDPYRESVKKWVWLKDDVSFPTGDPYLTEYVSDKETVPVGVNFNVDAFTPFANIKFDWGNARVIVSKSGLSEHTDTWERKNVYILSNGVFQFAVSVKENPFDFMGPPIDKLFYINIEPTVTAEHERYPFAANRQSFSPQAKSNLGVVFKYLSVTYGMTKLDTRIKGYGRMEYVDADGRISQGRNLAPKLSKKAKEQILKVNKDDDVKVVDGRMIVNGQELQTLDEKAVYAAKGLQVEFLIPQKEVFDPTLVAGKESKFVFLKEGKATERVIIHDGFNVTATGKSLVQTMRAKFGAERVNKYFFGVGSIFSEIKNKLAKEIPKKEITKRQPAGGELHFDEIPVGIFFQPSVAGLFINAPFTGFFINPGQTDFDFKIKERVRQGDIERVGAKYADLREAKIPLEKVQRLIAHSTVGTMVHELAHLTQRNHNSPFAGEMQILGNILEVTMDMDSIRERMFELLRDNYEIYEFTRDHVSAVHPAPSKSKSTDKVSLVEPYGGEFEGSRQRYAGSSGDVEAIARAGEAGQDRDVLAERARARARDPGEVGKSERFQREAKGTRSIDPAPGSVNTRPKPLFSVYSSDTLPFTNNYLPASIRKLTDWIRQSEEVLFEIQKYMDDPTDVSEDGRIGSSYAIDDLAHEIMELGDPSGSAELVSSGIRAVIERGFRSGNPYSDPQKVINDFIRLYTTPAGKEFTPMFARRYMGPKEVEDILADTMPPALEDITLMDKMRGLYQKLFKLDQIAVHQGLLDKVASWKYKEIEDFGNLMDASQSPYKGMLAVENLPSVMTGVMLYGIPELKDGAFTRVDGRMGFVDVFRPAVEHKEGNLLHLQIGYMVGLRANKLIKEENKDGTQREKLFTQDQIDKLLELADVNKYPEYATESGESVFKVVQKNFNKFNNELLDLTVQAAVNGADDVAIWKDNFWVSFQRGMDEVEHADAKDKAKKLLGGIKKGRGRGGGIADITSGIKPLKGAPIKLGPVFENILMNTAYLIDASFRNEANLRLFDYYEGTALQKVELKTEAVKVSDIQLANALRKGGLIVGNLETKEEEDAYVKKVVQGMTKEQKKHWSVLFRKVAPIGEHGVISALKSFEKKDKKTGEVTRGVERVYAYVEDPLLLKAVQGLGSNNHEHLWRLFSGSKLLLTTMVTTDPAFMLANSIRDTIGSFMVALPTLDPRYFVKAMQGFKSAWQEDEVLGELMLAGAGGGGHYETAPREIRKLLGRRMPTGQVDSFMNTIVSPKKMWRLWRKVGNASEQANRIAIYRTVIENGGTVAEAAYQARDVLNFSMSGDYAAIQFLVATIPFLNARMQGLHRLWRGAKDNPKAFATKGVMLAGLSLALLLKNWDEEEYKELAEWDKDLYWHVFIGGEHFRIPKPFEVGAMFATIPERLWRAVEGEDDLNLLKKRGLAMILDTFAFNPVPQLVKPIVEQFANKDQFTLSPIVGATEAGLPPEQQYTPWTSETMRELAEAMPDWAPAWLRSPRRLEHALRAYLGTTGMYLLSVADYGTRNAFGYPEKPEMDLRDYPVVSRFWRSKNPRYTSYSDNLYDMLEEANTIYRGINAFKEEKRFKKARELEKGNLSKLNVREYLNEIVTEVREVNQEIRDVHSNKTMSPARKRSSLARLQKRKNKIISRSARYAEYF